MRKFSSSTMPVPPYSAFSSKPSPRRLLFTAATAIFVVGGLCNLALDQDEVAFAMPEPPARPLVNPLQPAPAEAPADDALDDALAHVMANLSR